MAGTYRLTQKLMTLDSNQDLRGSEPRVLPVTPIIKAETGLADGGTFLLAASLQFVPHQSHCLAVRSRTCTPEGTDLQSALIAYSRRDWSQCSAFRRFACTH